MTKPDTKKTRLAGGFAAMFKPSGPAPAPEGKAGAAAAKKPRPRPAAKPSPVANTPAAHLAPDPGAAFGGKRVACFKWTTGEKCSAARPSNIPEDEPGPITYKGASWRLPEMLPSGTREAFEAHCEAAALESGAILPLLWINAKGGRARKHDRTGKRPSEIGIADGWQRYSVTIRKGHYLELERARAASGLSHKEIVDAALSRELARMKAELKGKK